MVSAWRFEGWSAAAPVGAVALYGTRRASSTMLCSMRLPPTGSAAKPLAMLRWVRPDQIVMLKLLRESRNKNLDFFATFLRLATPLHPGNAAISLYTAIFAAFLGSNPRLGRLQQSLIAKKLQPRQNFCF